MHPAGARPSKCYLFIYSGKGCSPRAAYHFRKRRSDLQEILDHQAGLQRTIKLGVGLSEERDTVKQDLAYRQAGSRAGSSSWESGWIIKKERDTVKLGVGLDHQAGLGIPSRDLL
jgi:hypothetical protein